MPAFTVSGQLIDLHQRRIYPARLKVESGIIAAIEEVAEAPEQYILPGFVDAHVHIESSMLTPVNFARMAVVQGTVATVSDPHEIANVCGVEGVQWMIDNAKASPFKCFFGAPSCVPATSFETAGATLDAAAVDDLLASQTWYLAEMMNYPGVLHGDETVMAKIAAAKNRNKPVDGHAPGLRGAAAKEYAGAGISTDHECTALQEALDKIDAGMHILIREGSAAKNFDALVPLLSSHSDRVMFCSDDKHPDDLALGHINALVRRALAKGYDLFDVLRAACVHPVLHYGLPVGLLRAGDPADFIVMPDLVNWQPVQTYINGQLVFDNGQCLISAVSTNPINQFKASARRPEDFRLATNQKTQSVRVIVAHDGQLVTTAATASLDAKDGNLISDAAQDVLKVVVINRYESYALPAIALIRGFGLKQGAIASTVAHDSHNIIAVGVDDASICAAVNAVIESKGGIAVASSKDDVEVLPLPIAGLISDKDGHEVGNRYAALSKAAKDLGSTLHAPFMTLSFMALLVIPSLKLSDKGLFDGEQFCFTDVLIKDAS